MKQFREPPEELALREFLSTADNVRWAAVMPHLLRELLPLCPRSCQSGYEQVWLYIFFSIDLDCACMQNNARAVLPDDAVLVLFQKQNRTVLFAAESQVAALL